MMMAGNCSERRTVASARVGSILSGPAGGDGCGSEALLLSSSEQRRRAAGGLSLFCDLGT